MEIRPGINLWLSSITWNYQNADGTIQQKTYRAGDPEFDTYVAEERRKREKAKSAVDARKMAAYYNGDDRNSKDFIYYDTDLYYQSEEMKGTILEMIQRTGKKYGFPDVDFPEGYPEEHLFVL